MTTVPHDPELDRAREIARHARSLGWRGGWISDAETFIERALSGEAPATEPEPEPAAPRILPTAPPDPVPLYASRPTRYVARHSTMRRTRAPRVDDFLDRWGEKRRRPRPA